MGQVVKKECEQHLGHVGATMAQQQHDTEDHFKLVDTEILWMKAVFSHVPSPTQAMGNVEELDLATRVHQTRSNAEAATEPRERQESIVEDLEANMTEIGTPEEP